MASIKFGTDGWRAIVGEDFTSENVEIVTNAIGKYVFDAFGLKKKILIGYDPRNMAKEFANQSAKILSSKGFQVIVSSKVIPTPVLAYGAKLYNACSIMFTASHNPPKYLGMKFIPDYAGPATSKITDAIVSNLGKSLPEKKGKIEEFDFAPPYFKHLETIINFEKIKTLKTQRDVNIVLDGLYSASIGYLDKILDKFEIPYQALHMKHDPNFGGGMPDPKPKYLKELIEIIKQEPNTIGLSTDGDADRFGIVNEKGEFVSPNEIIAIFLLYLKDVKKLEGPLVKTISGSILLNKIAEALKIEVIETAVGFKNVGEAMRKSNAIIGGEESGGLSIQGHIPEKDGILADLLILEIMAVKNKSIIELQKELYEVTGIKFFNDRIDLKLESQEQVKNSIDATKQIKELNDFKVIRIDTKDGVKLYFDDNTSWLLVRPSGTEPLLRIYFESDSLEKIEKIKNYVNSSKLFCKINNI